MSYNQHQKRQISVRKQTIFPDLRKGEINRGTGSPTFRVRGDIFSSREEKQVVRKTWRRTLLSLGQKIWENVFHIRHFKSFASSHISSISIKFWLGCWNRKKRYCEDIFLRGFPGIGQFSWWSRSLCLLKYYLSVRRPRASMSMPRCFYVTKSRNG